MKIHRFVATAFDKTFEVEIEPTEDGQLRVLVDGRSRVLDARRVEGGVGSALYSLVEAGGGRARLLDVDGRAGDYLVTPSGAADTAGAHPIAIKLQAGLRSQAAAPGARPSTSGPLPVRAPMPGKVVKVLVAPGDAVKAGQGVVVIEAMKMENELKSTRDGTVESVPAKEGQAVEAGQVLATVA